MATRKKAMTNKEAYHVIKALLGKPMRFKMTVDFDFYPKGHTQVSYTVAIMDRSILITAHNWETVISLLQEYL